MATALAEGKAEEMAVAEMVEGATGVGCVDLVEDQVV